MKVPVRRKEVYQTDDGRHVEVFTRINEIEALPDTEESQISQEETIFVGSAHIPLGAQSREIKFEIPECKTVDEAFGKYYELAEAAAEEFYKMLQEKMIEHNNKSKIAVAGAGALQELNEMQEEKGKLII